jgi:hypothetical protein
MKTRIYIDTSVVGGCEDEEFREYSSRLMACFSKGEYILVLSDLTIQELAGAPEEVRRHLTRIPEERIVGLQLDAEARDLADAYISEGVIASTMRTDAQHIAMATVGKVDVLVSWNFKHIVNIQRIRGYNSVNIRRGYPMLEIRSPREVLIDD